MKKAINIPNIDMERYNIIKQQCKENEITISEYFNRMIAEQTQGGQANDEEYNSLRAGYDDVKQENEELKQKIVELKTTLSRKEKELSQANDKYNILQRGCDGAEEAVEEYKQENEELKNKCIAKDAELEEYKREIEKLKSNDASLETIPQNSVIVPLTPLELALIEYVAAKEQERNKDKTVTPATLLKAMFVNYTIHGDMYFFPHPSRSILRLLKAQVEAREAEKGGEIE